MPDTELPSVADCERIFRAALGKGDTRGVEAALLIVAVQDPHRADKLMQEAKTVLDFVAAVDSGQLGMTREDVTKWIGADHDGD